MGGVMLSAWIDMYDDHRRRGQWPDGGPYLSQPNITVRVLQVIESQMIKEAKIDGKRS